MATPTSSRPAPTPAPVPRPVGASKQAITTPPPPQRTSRLGAAKRERLREALRHMFYGPPGIGKTSLLADIDGLLLIDIEGGSAEIEATRYTIGKGCKKCGGSAKPGAVERGCGFLRVAFASSVESPPCDGCAGTGWKLDRDGKPDAPRLDARQRETDETLEEFEERLADEVATRVDEFLSRGVVVRLENEMPRMRQELLDTIAAMRVLDERGLAPPNHDACVRGRETCAFFAACSGRADINDEFLFPRGAAHSELASAA